MVHYQMCWYSHTSQHCMRTNGVALPVHVTEILIYCWIEPFPCSLSCKINMYLSVWRPFHHTKLHVYMLSSLIKCNVGGEGGGGGEGYLWPYYGSVTPGLTIAVTPGLTIALLPQASLWFCYPRPRHGCYPCMASL